MPGCYPDSRAPLALQRGEAVRAVDAAPERYRMLRERESLRPTPAAPPETSAPGLSWMVPNRVLVRFRPDVSPEARRELLRAAGARVREELAGQELLIEFEPTAAGSAAAQHLANCVAVALCRRVMVIAVGYEAETEDAAPVRTPVRAARIPAALAGVR